MSGAAEPEGRELDEAVAEHVFGRKPGVDFWDLPDHDFKPGGDHDRCGFSESLGYGEYSSCYQDVEVCAKCGATKCCVSGHAQDEVPARCSRHPGSWLSWEGLGVVVEAMKLKIPAMPVEIAWLPTTEMWSVRFWRNPARAHAETVCDASAPRCVCLAALKALRSGGAK